MTYGDRFRSTCVGITQEFLLRITAACKVEKVLIISKRNKAQSLVIQICWIKRQIIKRIEITLQTTVFFCQVFLPLCKTKQNTGSTYGMCLQRLFLIWPFFPIMGSCMNWQPLLQWKQIHLRQCEKHFHIDMVIWTPFSALIQLLGSPAKTASRFPRHSHPTIAKPDYKSLHTLTPRPGVWGLAGH